jgi:DNA-binding response OmpR family regulator
VLERFLKWKGYDVVTAPDGPTALALVRKERPHLMLLDVDMPEMSGLEVLKLLRDVDKEIGVIMVTGNTDPDTAEWTLKRGASDYIVKPLNFQYLETTVMTKLLLLTR